jgi:hypothetical protein
MATQPPTYAEIGTQSIGTDGKVDVNNFLGHNYSAYKSKIYALAISKPSVYFKMRESVIQKVKTNAVQQLYDTFFFILRDGTDARQNNVVNDGDTTYAPSMPLNSINNFCLSASATLDEICEECVNMILPIDFNTIMNRKLVQTGMAENPQS